MAVCDRPRERMILRGAEALSDQELLAILIGSGNKERSVNAIAKDLMELLDKKAVVTMTS
jgi:DNA repair protein RadC